MSVTTLSVNTLPVLGTKQAPEKFRGDYTKVDHFIKHFERLLAQHNVTDDVEKCQSVILYCSRSVVEFIQALDNYITPDWDLLKKDIKDFYDADLDITRYKVKDLTAYVKKTKKAKMGTLSTWKKYARGFIRIGGWLKAQKKISDSEHMVYFWEGIPRTMKKKIEERLLSKEPNRDMSKPFTVKEITDAAEAILQRNRFDNIFGDSDNEELSDEGLSSDEESDSESSDDSDAEYRKRRSKKAKKLKKLKTKKKVEKKKKRDDSEDEEVERKVQVKKSPAKKTQEDPEVETLIKQLNGMSLDDPSYNYLYWKAVKIDKDIGQVVRQPFFSSAVAQQQQYPQPPPFQRQYPPPMGPYVPRGPPPGRGDYICYGCGETGHGITQCAAINELVAKGTIIKDHGGRIVNPDGSFIRRQGTETFLQAITRDRAPQSHFIMLTSPEVQRANAEESDDDVYIIPAEEDPEDTVEVYPADARIKGKAREKFDGVQIPLKRAPAKALAKEKEREKEIAPVPPAVAKAKKHSVEAEPQVIRRIQPSRDKDVIRSDENKPALDPTPPVQIPFDVRRPDFDSENDDEIMEDPEAGELAIPKVPSSSNPIDPPISEKTVPSRKKPQPRQSAISAFVDPMHVLNQVLGTQVHMALGEILGVSNKLSDLLIENMKKKSNPRSAMVATSFVTRDRGLLIRLKMEIDRVPVTAIIDTGSQLNIVNTILWKKTIQRPMDKSQSISMNDANGGKGILQGLVQNVPLSCGGVVTHANLYVGSHVPFQLLLGRPWQRGNYISIDERLDGTWLVFKDPKDLEPRYEILVQPEEQGDWEVNINFPNFPGIYMITTPWNRSRDNGTHGIEEVTRSHLECRGTFHFPGDMRESEYPSHSDQIRAVSGCSASRFKLRGIQEVAQNSNQIEISAMDNMAHGKSSQFRSNENHVAQRMTQDMSWHSNDLKLGQFSEFYRTQFIPKSTHKPALPKFYSVLPFLAMPYSRIPSDLIAIDDLNFNYALVTPNSEPVPRAVWTSEGRSDRSTFNRALRSVDFLDGINRTRSMAISSPHAIELGTQIDAQGNSIRELVLPHAGVFTEGDNTGIMRAHAHVKLYTLKEHPTEGPFTVAFPSIPNLQAQLAVEPELPDLEYPEPDSETFNASPAYSPTASFEIYPLTSGDIPVENGPMAIELPHSPTNTDRCGISGVSDDEMEYHERPKPSRTQFPSLPPRRLSTYPTKDHPDEAEDTSSVTTEPEEHVPETSPIPFIVPPQTRSSFTSYPLPSTTETRHETQSFLCGANGRLAYLQMYGAPSESENSSISASPTPSERAKLAIYGAHVRNSSSDSLPDLIPVSDSDEISSSADEMERRWIRTKDFRESNKTKSERVALEKKRRMVRDRIDEKKRSRLLKVARENEQETEKGEIRLISDNGYEQCAPCGHGVSPCILNAPTDSLSRATLLSSTLASEIHSVLAVDTHSLNSPAIYSALLENERLGHNSLIEKTKITVLTDEDMDVLSSDEDEAQDVVLKAMSSFIQDARHYRLIENHRAPVPSPWDEDRDAPNSDEAHFRPLQDTLEIIIQDTPSSPSHDFISGQLQIFATRIPLYRRYRDRLVEALEYVRDALSEDQWREATRDTLNVYKLSETRANFFIETLVDRFRWYEDNYPCLNSLFTLRESTFLRGASDTLRRHGRKRFSKSIDRLLNTPIPDRHIIAELLDKGYLESDDANDYEALAFVKLQLEKLVDDDDLEYVQVD